MDSDDPIACYNSFPGWDGSLADMPSLAWSLVLSDVLIFLSLVALGTGIAAIVISRRSPPFSDILGLFALVCYASGLTHLMDVWMFFDPAFTVAAVFQWTLVAFTIAAVALGALKYNRILDFTVLLDDLTKVYEHRRIEMLERVAKLEAEQRKLG